MKKIVIGKNTHDQPVSIDIERLISTRMLIQANSGGGKSWALRVLCERIGPSVPLIVLDWEGEFASLREELDVLLVGRDGEIPSHVATAGALATQILEMGVSAVIDLYDLNPQEKRAYVRRFIESMMAVPKRLWRPYMVIVDEAHSLAPETGDAESADAVKALASAGRKRQFCAVLATQRLSKLHKDAAAECLPPGQHVLTADGSKAIEDIQQGDCVLTHHGRFRKVSATLRRQYYGTLITIKTRGSNIPLCLTPDHPVLVRHCRKPKNWKRETITQIWGEPEWVRAGDLTDRHFILSPNCRHSIDRKDCVLPHKFVTKYRNGKTARIDRTRQIPIDNTMMIVIGYYLAEGSICASSRSMKIHFSFGKGEQELRFATEVSNALKRLGYKCAVFQKQSLWCAETSNTGLANWLKENFGTGAHHKKIPAWVLRLPEPRLWILLQSYVNGDGYITPTSIEGRTVSRSLAMGIRQVMLRAGLRPTIYTYAPHHTSIKGGSMFWIIRAWVKRGQCGIDRDESGMWLKIRSIDSTYYEGIVHNLEVVGDNSFCAGVYAVHNCNNVLIGRTTLDVDQKRAGDVLGMSKHEYVALRALREGWFYGFGPALSFDGVQQFKSEGVKTTHGSLPGANAKPPEPSARMRAAVAQLQDLAERSKTEVLDLDSARGTISDLRKKLAAAEKKTAPAPNPGLAKADVDSVRHAIDFAFRMGVEHATNEIKADIASRISPIVSGLHPLPKGVVLPDPLSGLKISTGTRRPVKIDMVDGVSLVPGARILLTKQSEPYKNGVVPTGLSKCQSSILRVLYQYETRTKNQVAVIAGYAVSSGNFNNALSGLRSSGFMEGRGDDLTITPAGRTAIGPQEPLPSGQDLFRYWAPKLSKCEVAIMMALNNGEIEMSKEMIGAATGYEPTSGNFNNALSRLRTLELIQGRGSISLNPLLRD